MTQKQDKREKTYVPPVSWKLRLRPAIFTLLLLIVVAISHAASIWNDFALDDRVNIKPFGLVSIEKRKWEPVWFELYTDAFQKPFSEPMKKLSLAFDYQSGHLSSPAVYHATNVLVQALGIVAAFFVLLKLADGVNQSSQTKTNYALPLFACAMFCAHPVTSESVAYISARSSIFCFFWYMVALGAFMVGFSSKSVARSVLGTLSAYLVTVVALFASPQSITLPWTMLFLAMLVKPSRYTYREWLYERSYELAGILLMGIALPFLFLIKSPVPSLYMIGAPTLTDNLFYLSQLKSISYYYLRIFFVPVGLSIHPAGTAAASILDPFVLLSIFALLLALYGLWHFKKRPFFILGLFLFIAGFLPQCFIPTALIAHGARFYLSAFGLTLSLCDFVFARLEGRLRFDPVELAQYGFSRRLALLALIPVLLLAGLSNWRDHAYQNSRSIIRNALKLNKNDDYLKALLAFKLTQEGGPAIDEGADMATDVLHNNSQLVFAILAQANYFQSKQNFKQATIKYEEALKMAQDLNLDEWIVAYCEGGVARSIVVSRDLTDKAEAQRVKAYSEHALKFDPTVARLYLAHGLALLSEDKPESAERAAREYDKGRRFDLNDPAFAVPVAQAAMRTGYSQRMEQAFGAAKVAYRLNPRSFTRLLFARAALESGRLNRGYSLLEEYFKNEKQPDAEAYYVLSGLERQSGRPKVADAYLQAALQRDKNVEQNRLFLTVKPKPTKDEENQGPSSIDPGKFNMSTTAPSPKPAQTPAK